MKTKYIVLGLFVIGILFAGSIFITGVKGGDDTSGDEDDDGIKDEVEEENKRYVEVWIGENVIEIASINRGEVKKDIIDLRVGFDECGISIRVSYGTYVKCDSEEPEEPDEPEESGLQISGDCGYEIDFKLTFEVWFQGLLEYIDLDENGVLEEEFDEVVSESAFNSFQPIDYSLQGISEDTNLHYIVVNTTDGVFALHIYLVEEFVYVNETLITPTEAKIDIEITNYNYTEDNSKLALFTKLWSEETYKEKEKTEDEEKGYATDEKEVYVNEHIYSGFFSWKETALVDGIEMEVFTKRFDYGEEDVQKLIICYPRGDHIYHDPKIGILIGSLPADISPVVITISAISIVGTVIVVGLVLRRRRIL
ncbi:MAG: hypothetical protein ACFE96_13720 [Candidatus Hermodarchaeota archaeon]